MLKESHYEERSGWHHEFCNLPLSYNAKLYFNVRNSQLSTYKEKVTKEYKST